MNFKEVLWLSQRKDDRENFDCSISSEEFPLVILDLMMNKWYTSRTPNALLINWYISVLGMISLIRDRVRRKSYEESKLLSEGVAVREFLHSWWAFLSHVFLTLYFAITLTTSLELWFKRYSTITVSICATPSQRELDHSSLSSIGQTFSLTRMAFSRRSLIAIIRWSAVFTSQKANKKSPYTRLMLSGKSSRQ